MSEYELYVNNIVLLINIGSHSGMIDDTSSDDQEVIRMEDVLLENIDMLTDKRLLLYCHAL